MAHTWVIVVVTIRLHSPAHRDVVRRFALSTHAGERGHRERNYNVDLVGLLVLGDAPTSARLDCNRTTDRKPNAGIGIGNEVSTANNFVKVLRRVGQIAGGLGKLLDVDPSRTLGRDPIGSTFHGRGNAASPRICVVEAEMKAEIRPTRSDGRRGHHSIVAQTRCVSLANTCEG